MVIYQVTKSACISELLIWPGFISVVAIGVLAFALFRIVKISKDWVVRILLLVFISIAIVSFVFTQLHLLRRGVFLPFEDQQETVIGTVQSVVRDPKSPRFSLGNGKKTSYAHMVEVDGRVYYCLTAEGISSGRQVELHFLPRSGVVLTCIVWEGGAVGE